MATSQTICWNGHSSPPGTRTASCSPQKQREQTDVHHSMCAFHALLVADHLTAVWHGKEIVHEILDIDHELRKKALLKLLAVPGNDGHEELRHDVGYLWQGVQEGETVGPDAVGGCANHSVLQLLFYLGHIFLFLPLLLLLFWLGDNSCSCFISVSGDDHILPDPHGNGPLQIVFLPAQPNSAT